MPLRRILLTGDDGFQSLGTRLLVHLLKDSYDLTIAGTVTQQSGVGGKVSLATGFHWGKTEVDGVPAFWVEGTPSDAAELMASYQQQPFDLTISGVNWGANLGMGVYSSGTVMAAIAALRRKVSNQAISISWDCPPKFYLMHHNLEHTLDEYLEYPGQSIKKILIQSIENQLWGAQLLNINLPNAPTSKVHVAKLTQSMQEIYSFDDAATGEEGQYSYVGNGRKFSPDVNPDYDARSMTDGNISITPCKIDILDTTIYEQLQKVNFDLS